MTKEQQWTVSHQTQLKKVAQEISRKLTEGDLVLLTGELGSGKTTFVQILATVLKAQRRPTSPSYTLLTEIALQQPPFTHLLHGDLYRLTHEQAQTDPMVAEMIARLRTPGRLTVLEWADRLGFQLPNRYHAIHFSHTRNEQERIITYHLVSP